MWRTQAANGRRCQNWDLYGCCQVRRLRISQGSGECFGQRTVEYPQAHSAGRKELPLADNCFGDRSDAVRRTAVLWRYICTASFKQPKKHFP
ncbi:hypothetical protein PspLS_03419 [Pyricularia sp. CBS 133598]|nr:hypothetical protein PspLS_03419 [Pyricularia sp. CBS 133598]